MKCWESNDYLDLTSLFLHIVQRPNNSCGFMLKGKGHLLPSFVCQLFLLLFQFCVYVTLLFIFFFFALPSFQNIWCTASFFFFFFPMAVNLPIVVKRCECFSFVHRRKLHRQHVVWIINTKIKAMFIEQSYVYRVGFVLAKIWQNFVALCQIERL